MNASELKYNVKGNFFSRESMRFFGDSMKNYGVRSATVKSNYDLNGEWSDDGVSVEAWELYRKNPVKFWIKSSAYFSKLTFERIHPKIEESK